MRNYKLLFFLVCFPLIFANAQDGNCSEKLEKARRILFKKNPFGEQKNLMDLVRPCADKGNAQAENYLGMFYLNGIETEQDVSKAFAYISSAAKKGYPAGQYNLGRLYKQGVGCEPSFAKAIEWFKKATENGNQRAAYTLGYMYYKGFGVPQDYKKAVYWFEQSTDKMATHFLALCHYLGYGVPVNETKALELLQNNDILNSKTLIENIKNKKKEENQLKIAEALDYTTSTDSTHIEAEVVSNINTEANIEGLNKEDFIGEWTGKLVQYDWSGKVVERILPISINFTSGDNDGEVGMKMILADEEKTTTALWQDGYLYFNNNLIFTVDRLYPDNPRKLSLDYTVLSINLKQKTLLDNTYLTGAVDAFVGSWSEYGRPMALVLKGKKTSGLTAQTLEALAAQNDQFIKLYPVPFNNTLTVQYQLETPSSIYVELISLDGMYKTVVQPTIMKPAGEHTHNITVNSDLPEGLYVVRLTAGNELYTRLIIKDDN